MLFTGDLLFVGLTPLVFAGSVDGALRALEWIAGFRPDVVVPGHGPITSGADLPEVLADHERYYHFVPTWPPRAWPKGPPRSSWPGPPTSEGSPTGPTPSGWSSTSTGPTPTPRAGRWTRWRPCSTP